MRVSRSRSSAPRQQPRAPDVAVAGSCLTRDNFNSRFNANHHEQYDVRASSNQSSMIALMSPPIHAAFEPLRPMNDYDLWNIRADLTREFLPRLAEAQPDLLLLDFQGDVRFGVARLPDGRYFTDHSWKTQHTDFYVRLAESGRSRCSSPRTIPIATSPYGPRRWTGSRRTSPRRARRRRSSCTAATTPRGSWSRGEPRPVPLHRDERFRGVDLAAADAWWARLDDYAVATFGWDQIDLRDLDPRPTAGIPWGAYYGTTRPTTTAASWPS